MTKGLDAIVRDILCSHPGDPANARYLVPLEDPEQEKMAQCMADFIFGCGYAPDFDENTTQEEEDRIWRQCQIDARRMLCDEDYARLFGDGPEFDEVEV